MFNFKAENYTFIGNATGGTLALPTGWAANDIMILIAETAAAEPVTAPSGYTEVTGSPQIGADTRLSVFWRRAVAGDTAPVLADPGDHIAAALVALSGAATSGDPFIASSGTTVASGSTSVSFPSVTPGVGNGILNIMSIGTDSLTRPISLGSMNQPGTDPTVVETTTDRESVWVTTTLGNGGGADMYFGVATTAGAIASTATAAGTGAKALLSLVIAAEPDTGANVYSEQLITVVEQMGPNQLVQSQQLVTVVDQMGLNQVLHSAQMITVVVEPQDTRRKNFMSFVP